MKKRVFALILTTVFLLSLSGCTVYPEETRLAKDYLGMTFGEIKELWGEDCVLGGDILEGLSKGVCYENKRTPYVFLFEEEVTELSALSDDAVITRVRGKGDEGKPCEVLEGSEPHDILQRLYRVANGDTLDDPQSFRKTTHIRGEVVSVDYYYSFLNLDFAKNPPDVYEVYVTPELYRTGWHWHDSPRFGGTEDVIDEETGEVIGTVTVLYDEIREEWRPKEEMEAEIGSKCPWY